MRLRPGFHQRLLALSPLLPVRSLLLTRLCASRRAVHTVGRHGIACIDHDHCHRRVTLARIGFGAVNVIVRASASAIEGAASA